MSGDDSTSSTDAELVARMARGDRGALGELYERHAPRLNALARQISGPAEAEDVLHDVFLEAWRRAGDYSEQRGTVWAWLAIRARSRALDRRRALAGQQRAMLAEANFGGFPLGATESENAPDARRLREALGQMSADEQRVLWLGYFEGLSSSEIAARTRVPIGTVKSRTRSALEKLRRCLAAERSRR